MFEEDLWKTYKYRPTTKRRTEDGIFSRIIPERITSWVKVHSKKYFASCIRNIQLRNIYTCQSTDSSFFVSFFLDTLSLPLLPLFSILPFSHFAHSLSRPLLSLSIYIFSSSPPPPPPIVSLSLSLLTSASPSSSSLSVTPLESACGRASGLIANIISSLSHKRAAVRIWMTASAFLTTPIVYEVDLSGHTPLVRAKVAKLIANYPWYGI